MSQATYQLIVYNPDGHTVIDIVTQGRWFDFYYERSLNDIGEFRISLPDTDPLVNYRTVTDLIIDVYRAFESPDLTYEASYLCRYSDIGIVDEGGREVVIISGYHANHLLNRRYMIPNDDPVGAGGFITRGDAANVVMSELVRYQCINPQLNSNRAMPDLSIAPDSSEVYFDTFQRLNEQDKLLTVLQAIANQERDPQWIDFEIQHDENGFIFYAVRQGQDRSYTHDQQDFVLFDELRATLRSPRLRYDRKDEITSVWVGGQGYISDRVYIAVTDTAAAADSPYNLIEDIIDARQSTLFNELQSAGDSYLNENRAQILFDFDLVEGASLMNYGVDWNLGDIVTVSYRGYTEDHRIIGVTIRTEGTRETISIKTLFWRSVTVEQIAQPLLIDLAAYWSLNEVSGIRYDSFGDNDLSDNNGVGWVIGVQNNAAEFVGASSQYLSLANAESLRIQRDFTALLWLEFDAASMGVVTYAFSKYGAGPNREYFLTKTAANLLAWRVSDDGSTTAGIFANTFGAVSVDTRYMVIVHYDQANQEIGISVNNGVTDVGNFPNPPWQADAEFQLGQLVGTYLSGNEDEFAVWHRLLTAEEKTWLYNSGAGRNFEEIKAYSG